MNSHSVSVYKHVLRLDIEEFGKFENVSVIRKTDTMETFARQKRLKDFHHQYIQ